MIFKYRLELETYLQETFNAIFKNMLAHMSINGWQWIIQKIDIRLSVNGTRQTDSSPLSSAQAYPSLSDKGVVTMRQNLKISFQSTNLNHFVVSNFMEIINY